MDWQWDEFHQIGTDYESVGEVANYDRRMRELRDVDAENRAIVAALHLPSEATVMEIGTGTGAFARTVASDCRRVIAIDISPVMLAYAAQRADEEGHRNIEFRRDGFLSFSVAPASLDAVVTALALHHLPDLWKAVALRRIFSALKPGGILVLHDVVFDWHNSEPEEYFNRQIAAVDNSSRTPFIRHIAQEYSTLSWIMTGLLERAGFVIADDITPNGFLHFYHCRKP
ncbi:MAG: class I SAM-dependent methyltransferase [Victivallales bacterium]|nr:class I SAM-dependent methyltransferase [Victivallales bacterium]